MTINSLMTWFTLGLIQCVSHTIVYSPWEKHLDEQDKSSLQLGGSALQSQIDCPNSWIEGGIFITFQGTYDLDFLYNF